MGIGGVEELHPEPHEVLVEIPEEESVSTPKEGVDEQEEQSEAE